jgi:hypothetical protein
MTALFVIQFLSLLWAAGLSVWLAVVAGQCRDTRRSVLAAFKDKPNPLHLPLRPASNHRHGLRPGRRRADHRAGRTRRPRTAITELKQVIDPLRAAIVARE